MCSSSRICQTVVECAVVVECANGTEFVVVVVEYAK